MLKTIGLATAAALLSSVVAFAQNADTQSPAGKMPSPDANAPASADEPSMAAKSGTSDDMGKATGMRRHHRRAGASTDNLADRLNACVASANPTPEQEQCLREAESGQPSQPQ